MSYKLFLDDERFPVDCEYFLGFRSTPIYTENDWVIVRNFTEFVEVIYRKWMTVKETPSLISFDHDLAQEKTGKDCANWLVDFCIENQMNLPNWLVHSRNPVGAENINSILEQYKKFINSK